MAVSRLREFLSTSSLCVLDDDNIGVSGTVADVAGFTRIYPLLLSVPCIGAALKALPQQLELVAQCGASTTNKLQMFLLIRIPEMTTGDVTSVGRGAFEDLNRTSTTNKVTHCLTIIVSCFPWLEPSFNFWVSLSSFLCFFKIFWCLLLIPLLMYFVRISELNNASITSRSVSCLVGYL
ncbi:hypothetical protein ACFX2F_005311 [Malus domestica]